MDSEYIDITVLYRSSKNQKVINEDECPRGVLRCVPVKDLDKVLQGIFMTARAGLVYKIILD